MDGAAPRSEEPDPGPPDGSEMEGGGTGSTQKGDATPPALSGENEVEGKEEPCITNYVAERRGKKLYYGVNII